MAFYLIILIGTLLILFNYNAIKKEKKSFKNILNEEVDNMDEFKILIGETKKEFTEIILELQQEIQDINEKFNLILKNNKKDDESTVEKVQIYDKIEDNKNKKNIKIKDNKSSSNNVKINEIEDLLKQGFSIDDIAGKLNIGKGEVLLIKELYLK